MEVEPQTTPQVAGVDIECFDDDDTDYDANDDDKTFGTSGDSTTTGKNIDSNYKDSTDIAREESRIVFVARIIVVLLVFGLAVGVAFAVNNYLYSSQTHAFEVDFYFSRNLILEQLGINLVKCMAAIDGLMVSLVSYQESSNSSWPFVTAPNFDRKANFALSTTSAFLISVYPRVLQKQREKWENYTATSSYRTDIHDPFPYLHTLTGVLPPQEKYYPVWQSTPYLPHFTASNFDMYTSYLSELNEIEQKRTVVMGRTDNIPTPGNEAELAWAKVMFAFVAGIVGSSENPASPFFSVFYPIVSGATGDILSSDLDVDRTPVVGGMAAGMFWHDMIKNILSPATKGLIVVIGSDCNQTLTYRIDGPSPVFLGRGDLHDPKYSSYGSKFYLYSLLSNTTSNRQEVYTGIPLSTTYCPYYVYVYPSDISKQKTANKDITLITVGVVVIFGVTMLFFFVYDFASERRQKKVLRVALQSTAIVSSIFPKMVRDRIFTQKIDPNVGNERLMETARLRLQKFLVSDDKGVHCDQKNDHENLSPPIAELFTDATVLFADIAGFTAWSSVREPTHVFTLLETIFSAFDTIASRRGVFKIETIGDCYVAVAGLPEPRADHAVALCKFARDIRVKMSALSKELARILGPDTIDLGLRIGLNSGPVTAGVLRGERSRFQLFGDTVDIASRMETTGKVWKIHVSPSTAVLLQNAGKGHWLTLREDEGAGHRNFQTYWVEPSDQSQHSIRQSFGVSGVDLAMTGPRLSQNIESNMRHLLDWNVEILASLIKKIVARRREARQQRESRRSYAPTSTEKELFSSESLGFSGTVPFDEVCEVIMLPEFDHTHAKNQVDWSTIDLGDDVMAQLRSYVSMVATTYRDNPFHNFEHASHVAMSVVKLLSRIVAPTDDVVEIAAIKGDFVQTLHDHTFGITSDPLTQFACVFSALIHDVDHPGIPNTQLVKEDSSLIALYKGKSLAEQNSIVIAWNLFMESGFEDLRNVICPSNAEIVRLRQLVVNVVMATDIMDKDLKALRNQRWEKAFNDSVRLDEPLAVNINRKATIVMEHLIQASDVAHTMQHWHVYRKWNERLFKEMQNGYNAGRAEKNPVEFWYQGELGFFDFYIIPLAKKLRDCGVFGVASDEYLSYALKNREEWEHRGKEIVASMASKLEVKTTWLQDLKEDDDREEEE